MKKLFLSSILAVFTIIFVCKKADRLSEDSPVENTENQLPTPLKATLHIDGRYLKDSAGKIVNLHGSRRIIFLFVFCWSYLAVIQIRPFISLTT